MAAKNYPTHAVTAYYRALARTHRVSLPLDNLPSRAVVETIHERAYVTVCNGSRTLAVYRVKPDGPLRRLKRWPKDLNWRT